MMRALGLALFTVIVSAAGVQDARACVCAGRETPRTPAELRRDVATSLNGAFAVFLGEPLASNTLTVRFRVDAVWKGSLGAEVVMATGAEALPGGVVRVNSCDRSFPFGRAYLVFAYGTDTDTMKARACELVGASDADIIETLSVLVARRAPSPTVAPRALVAVLGNVAKSGLLEWTDGLTVEEALARAGGFDAGASQPSVATSQPNLAIIRTRAATGREELPAAPTTVLLPDDQLVVGGAIGEPRTDASLPARSDGAENRARGRVSVGVSAGGRKDDRHRALGAAR